jgi:hypothetical protein
MIVIHPQVIKTIRAKCFNKIVTRRLSKSAIKRLEVLNFLEVIDGQSKKKIEAELKFNF